MTDLARLDRRADPLAAALSRYLLTGDETAMETVVRETRPRLLAVARRIGRPQDAEDAVQTAYIALVRHRGSELEAPVLPWLMTATVRAAYRRKAVHANEARLAQLLTREPSSDGGPLADLMSAEEAARVRDDLALLPRGCRDAIVLHYFQGLSTAETALLLGTSEAAVRVRLHRGRAILRARWIPRPLLGLVPLPWFIADLGKSITTGAGVSTGVVMTKTGIAGLVLIVAALSAFIGANYLAPRERAPDVVVPNGDGPASIAAKTPAPRRRAPEVASKTDPETVHEAAVPPTVSGARSSTERSSPPPDRNPESSATWRAGIDASLRQYLDTLKIPEGVAAEAKLLNVSDDALRAMYAAEYLVHFRTQSTRNEELGHATDDALVALAARGDEGFLAVAANARGNPCNTSRVDLLAKATWRAGLESSLIDWMRANSPRLTVNAPLTALGGIDSADSRAYLREALRTFENHATNFVQAASSLGLLHDSGAAGLVADKLRNSNWSGCRASMLDSLGRMGGDEAKRVLVEYLRDPAGQMESAALDALALIDRDGARVEAEALLSVNSPNKLEGEEPARVRRFLAK